MVWLNILGVTLVCGLVSQSIYVLGLLGLHLNLSHVAAFRPLRKLKEHQFSQWKPLMARQLKVCYLGHLLTVH